MQSHHPICVYCEYAWLYTSFKWPETLEKCIVLVSVLFPQIGNYKRTTKRIEDGNRLCDDLMKLVSERAEIEKMYAKSLKEWAKKWNNIIEKGKTLRKPSQIGLGFVVYRLIGSWWAGNLHLFVLWMQSTGTWQNTLPVFLVILLLEFHWKYDIYVSFVF